MGVGYAASPLHRIGYLDASSDVHEGPMRSRSPSKADILAWRDGISRKYRDQLGEDLSWDEDSAFERAEDAASGADMLLRYVAAVLDQRGETALRGLAGPARPSSTEVEPVFAEANRRGFGGRFPQLLLRARYWFPFQRHIIIEEPNWQGVVERYGSAPRLADELEEVRAAIASADPSATAWTADRPTPQGDTLAAAWQVSDTVSRLCAAANARRLPLWTTG